MIILSRRYVDDACDAIQSFIAWTLPKLTVAAERIDALRAYGKQEYGWCNLESDAIHHIEIKNLKYSYNNEGTDEKTLVLDGVSMSLFVGKTYAIVGRSGSGKTTLAKCLTRLHELQEGKILINGRIEMKEIDRDTLPRIIGMVSQRSNVFNGTIRDQFSDLPNYSYDRMVESLKIVGLWDDIISKPKGVDTKIGEKGMKLSGGQVQRLAIAIVLMQDPKILIMDEATSAQDSATQAEIYNNLRESGWLKRKIVIIIAHRLSTISNADEIFVLGDEGKLVGSGNHASLLETCDYYRKLVKEEKGNL
jgi:ABC-type multidrug transport system fused ATPase/permease subunit